MQWFEISNNNSIKIIMLHSIHFLCVKVTYITQETNLHCKNKIVKITKLLVNTVARNSGNCNLIGHVGCHYCIVIHMYLY